MRYLTAAVSGVDGEEPASSVLRRALEIAEADEERDDADVIVDDPDPVDPGKGLN